MVVGIQGGGLGRDDGSICQARNVKPLEQSCFTEYPCLVSSRFIIKPRSSLLFLHSKAFTEQLLGARQVDTEGPEWSLPLGSPRSMRETNKVITSGNTLCWIFRIEDLGVGVNGGGGVSG